MENYDKHMKIIQELHTHGDFEKYPNEGEVLETLSFVADTLETLRDIESSGVLGEEKDETYDRDRSPLADGFLAGHNTCRKEIGLRLAKKLEGIREMMEDLYGGTRDYPNCTEENEDAVLEIWNTAIEKCLEIFTNHILGKGE